MISDLRDARQAGLRSNALQHDCMTYFVPNARVFMQKRNALQSEFDELNHMLTHQPPSAWAKREKKYHDDKKTWDAQAADLKRKMKRLQDEVQVLKDNNRAVVLQEQVQVCNIQRVSCGLNIMQALST